MAWAVGFGPALGNSIYMRLAVLHRLSCCVIVFALTACAGLSGERLLYDHNDARIGIEKDPTISRFGETVLNAHPASLTAVEVGALFDAVRVSGWSGTIAGMFQSPRPVPLLTQAQLQIFAGPVAEALREAGPTERVFFSFPKPDVTYSEDRTAGALFLRGPYLHLVLTDHSSVVHADTGGGDVKDIRDTKGMKLWLDKPAVEAVVPDAEEPRWAPFESVHISVNIKQLLALTPARRPETGMREASGGREGPLSHQDLQNQIRELTNSNLELRERLDEQKTRIHRLNEEINRLRLELEEAKAGKRPSRKTP
jgi:hypothetical protein